MSKVSFVGARPDEKAMLLGEEFRKIDVLDFEASGGVVRTWIVLSGVIVCLFGDPRTALMLLPGAGHA